MEFVDEFRDLGTHHGEHVGPCPSCERVNASPRNHDERPDGDVVAYAVEFDFELPVDADERFLAAMMDVERRLISFVRIESPFPDNEVSHHAG